MRSAGQAGSDIKLCSGMLGDGGEPAVVPEPGVVPVGSPEPAGVLLEPAFVLLEPAEVLDIVEFNNSEWIAARKVQLGSVRESTSRRAHNLLITEPLQQRTQKVLKRVVRILET